MKLTGAPFLQCSAVRLAQAIRSRELKAVDVLEGFIQRLGAVSHLNCLVAERFDAAREEARAADRRVALGGDLPPFLGRFAAESPFSDRENSS